jgi:hypothetical protein
MSSSNIYSLTEQYKETVAKETDASLHSCELLYDIQSTLLKTHNNNVNDKKYKKAIGAFRDEVNISKPYFNKKIAVGAALRKAASIGDNLIRSMDINTIYKTYCAPPKQKKEPTPTVNWKLKYEQLQEGYKLMLAKYENVCKENKRLKSIVKELEEV